MANRTRKTRSSDPLKQLRLIVACEILGNFSHILSITDDIQHDSYVLELLDEYAIRVLIEWLGTKFGSNIYAKYFDPSNSGDSFSLSRLLENLRLYPFLDTSSELISEQLRQSADHILAPSFEPHTELIGSLYEHICNRPLVVREDGVIDVSPDIQAQDKRRIVGQFYTPPNIVRYCFDRYLQSDSIKFINALTAIGKRSSQQGSNAMGDSDIASWTMLDPACGTGNFLLGAIKVAVENSCCDRALISFAGNALYGMELDGKAASMARIAVALEVLAHCPGALPHVNDVESLLRSLCRHIVVSDSSIQGAVAEDGVYDLVVTNPPYVSFGSRDQQQILDSQRRLLKSIYPEGAEYKIRLHSIFQDIALRFCKPQGHAVLLVPDAFLTGSFYTRLRELLLRRAQIVSISELPEGTISGAVVGRWCVAQYRRREEWGNLQADRSERETGDYAVRLFSGCSEEPLEYEAMLSAVVSPDKSKFRLVFNEREEAIFRHIRPMDRLRTALIGHTGIRSLHGQQRIVSNENRGDTWMRGIKSGASVTPYRISWDGTWLNVDPALLYKGGFDSDVIANAKLMVRQTGDRLVAAVEETGLHHLNNVHSFSSSKLQSQSPERIDLYFVCALANSNFWLYLYQMITRERSRALAQIDIETAESLPLPPENKKVSALIARLSRNLHETTGNPITVDTTRVIDRLIYDLYELPETYIDYIESYCLKSKVQFSSDLPSRAKVEELTQNLC